MKKIVIWGTGQKAAKIVALLKEDIQIVAFIDNDK